MREAKIILKLYNIDELEKDVRQEAIEKRRKILKSEWTHDDVFYRYYEKVNELRLHEVRFHYSQFYAYKGGACMDFKIDTSCELSGTFSDFCKKIDYELPKNIKNEILKGTLEVVVETDTNYTNYACCPNSSSRTFDIQLSGDGKFNVYKYAEFKSDFENKLRVWYDYFCQCLFNELKENFEQSTSDEMVLHSFKKNNVEFYQNGAIYLEHENEIMDEE